MAEKFSLELEMTGLGVLVSGTGDSGANAQVLWLEGDWEETPEHRPTLIIDLAHAEQPYLSGDEIDHNVVRLPGGQTLLLIDLNGVDLTVDPTSRGTGVVLFKDDTGGWPREPKTKDDWRDVRFVAEMSNVTNGCVDPRHLDPGTFQDQIQGRFLFDKGQLEAGRPWDADFQKKKWTFSAHHEQHVTDRLIWKYTSSAEMRPITLRLRRKGRTSEITLAPRKAKEVIQIAASCYPDLSEGDAASLYDSPLRDYKPLEWDDFPLFYEVLTPKVKKKDRVKPQSDDPKSSISDAWCPMVQARARN